MASAQHGLVVGLFVGPEPGGPMQRVATVEVVVGRGVAGDRYFDARDVAEHDPTDEITLFAAEDVEAADAAAATDGVSIDAVDLRRNVMTSGLDLREANGRVLRVGEVVIDDVAANPPCAHLQQLAGKPLLKPLVDGGGIRGRIRQGGTIREGDAVQWLSGEPA